MTLQHHTSEASTAYQHNRPLDDSRTFYTDERLHLTCGDSLNALRSLASDSVHAVVCDPPYAIRARRNVRTELTRSVDDGHTLCADCLSVDSLEGLTVCHGCLRERELASFAGASMLGQQSPNWHEKATHSRGYADNDPATFQRWCSLWLEECLRILKPGGHLVAFGGTRTWHRLAVAAEDVGFEIRDSLAWLYGTGFPKSVNVGREIARGASVPDAAGTASVGGAEGSDHDWVGWGTALKPAHEPIVFARKPLAGTVTANLRRHAAGALNIDGCRIQSAEASVTSTGRWPTNAFLDASQAQVLDDSAVGNRPSRFFWVAKPSKAEKALVEGLAHPTVKPLDLMRELVRLVTPRDGVVLDPFAGSGTTVEACLIEERKCIAIEQDCAYVPLIEARIHRHSLVTNASGNDPDGRPEPSGDLVLFSADAL